MRYGSSHQQAKGSPMNWYKPFIVAALLSMLLGCSTQKDYTDTGVGCTDDCLEPVEEMNQVSQHMVTHR